jgi:RimJ/RimL family protein N-acetyltransferase
MLALPIEGHGLLLREFEDSDIPAVARIAATEGFSFYALAPHTASKMEIEESAVRFIQKAKDLQQIDPITKIRECYKLAVAEIATPDKLIGYVSLDEWSEQHGEKRDIGYFTDPRMQGRGHATFASALILDRFFAATNYDLVHATVHPENTPSRKILQKLGYAEIGKTIKHVRGQVEPRIVLTLLRQDFKAASAPLRDAKTDNNLVNTPRQRGALNNV